MKTKINIEGMNCSACSSRIEKNLNEVNGVEEAIVNLATSKGVITHNKSITTRDLIKIVDGLGFKASEEEKGVDFEKEHREKEINSLKRSFIISAILTIPLFSAMFVEMAGYDTILSNGYFQLVLASVVQFFIGSRFYRGAYLSLKGGGANMDVLIAMGTSAAYIYSVYNVIIGVHEYYFESSAMIITLILLGNLLESIAKGKTSEAIKKLMDLGAKTAKVIRNGDEIEIDIDEVLMEDKVVVVPGEKVPVDGVILEGYTTIDEAIITGESLPVDKVVGDKVVGGTININGRITFEAERVGKDTMISQIVQFVEDAQNLKAPVQRLADKIAGIFVPAVLIIAAITFVVWYAITGDLNSSIIPMVSVLVIACPCALGLATPTAVMVGTGRGAENGILIKGGEYLEITHKINTMVFDKTGTLTYGEPVLTDAFEIDYDKEKLIQLAASAENNSEHPIGKAIVDYAKDNNIQILPTEEFENIAGKGIYARIDSKELLVGNRKFLKESGIDIEKDEQNIDRYEADGKTTVAVAIDGKFSGVVAVADTVKETSLEAITELNNMGVESYMITGDNKQTANAIAKQVGIKSENILAEVLPERKAEEIEKLKKEGKVVGMAGDGVNDAPALAMADIGFSMGTGTDVAIETGDITLIRGDLRDIPKAIKLSNRTLKTVKQNLFWAFLYNTVGIPIAALNFLSPMIAGFAMAFSSVSVLTNSLRLRNVKIK